jgi:hypothetical protein
LLLTVLAALSLGLLGLTQAQLTRDRAAMAGVLMVAPLDDRPATVEAIRAALAGDPALTAVTVIPAAEVAQSLGLDSASPLVELTLADPAGAAALVSRLQGRLDRAGLAAEVTGPPPSVEAGLTRLAQTQTLTRQLGWGVVALALILAGLLGWAEAAALRPALTLLQEQGADGWQRARLAATEGLMPRLGWSFLGTIFAVPLAIWVVSPLDPGLIGPMLRFPPDPGLGAHLHPVAPALAAIPAVLAYHALGRACAAGGQA